VLRGHLGIDLHVLDRLADRVRPRKRLDGRMDAARAESSEQVVLVLRIMDDTVTQLARLHAHLVRRAGLAPAVRRLRLAGFGSIALWRWFSWHFVSRG
jgi:hypothetical protein